VRYSDGGKTAEFIYYNAKTGEVTQSMTQTVDQGKVIRAEISERDWKTKNLNPPLKVAFRYDEKGRLVEQNTEAHEFDPSGSEHELPPGRISIVYDDVKHTKTTEYSSPEGRLALKLTLDATGATVGFTGGVGAEMIDGLLDCSYDSHENWTAYRQVGRSGGATTVTKVWRRSIVYR
jgi:hypothetical protein